jgi:hypothetical protein
VIFFVLKSGVEARYIFLDPLSLNIQAIDLPSFDATRPVGNGGDNKDSID